MTWKHTWKQITNGLEFKDIKASLVGTYSLRPQKSVIPTFLENFFQLWPNFCKKINNIYQMKRLYDENIFYHESNDTNLVT
jgi:hypothetical protein